MALNHKLQTFVDVFDGDIQKASILAGITEQYGRLLMVSVLSTNIRPKALEVQEAIRQRRSTSDLVIKGEIASRQERQRFWTEILRGKLTDTVTSLDGEVTVGDAATLTVRMKASELLGKSELDFGERRVNTDLTLADIAARVGVEEPKTKELPENTNETV